MRYGPAERLDPGRGRRRSQHRAPGAVLVLLFAVTVLLAACGSTTAAPAPRQHHEPPATTRQSHGSTPRVHATASPRGTEQVAARWSGPQVLAEGADLASVSCTTTTWCMALATSGATWHYDGSHWSPAGRLAPSPGAGSGPVTGHHQLSCFESDVCVAIDGGAATYHYDGSTWSGPTSVPGAEPLQAIACAPSGTCVTIDGIGDAFVTERSGWSSALNGWGSAASISCVTGTFCAAAGAGMSLWNGSTWTKPAAIDGTALLTAVSCATATSCVAVDNEGDALVLDGVSWSPPHRIDGTARPVLTSVSCPAAGRCVVVDASGAVFSLAE
ncbi:MAG: hypothetical protein ACYCXY_07555, partial [Acidimicrobiales bacterium]